MTARPGSRSKTSSGTFSETISEQTWDLFLERLGRLGTPHPVTKIDGMPSRCAFDAKMRRDADFAARADAVWKRGHRATNRPASDWYSFLARLDELGAPHLVCRLQGMPHHSVYLAKRRRDPLFAQRVDALWRRGAYSDAVWDELLAHLSSSGIVEACSQPGMPKISTMQRRRQIDAAFNARVVAVIGDPQYRHLHQTRRDEHDWARFLLVLSNSRSIRAACKKQDMPDDGTVRRHARNDLGFRAALADIARQQAKSRIAFCFKRPKPRPAAIDARPSKRRSAAEGFQVALSRDELYAAVAAAVPKTLPPITRDDIICDMMLAVLEGQIDIGATKAAAKNFIRDHWRMFGTLRDKSLDANLFDDGAATLGDQLAGHGADYW